MHCLAGPLLQAHVDADVKLIASHTPASIPFHWQQKAYADLLRDETLGILESSGWEADYCQRETSAIEPLSSSFIAFPVGPGRRWLAHGRDISVLLCKSDRHLTTFIHHLWPTLDAEEMAKIEKKNSHTKAWSK